MSPNPAAVAYEAYRARMNADTRRGVFLVAWHLLPAVEQAAWFDAIGAAVKSRETGTDNRVES